MEIKRWFTTSDNVDIETGELLKTTDLKNYIKIGKSKKIELDERNKIGVIKYTNEYRHNGQTEFKF
jgi:hypothetical protein